MNPLTVIIPSRSIDNLIPCVNAVRTHEPAVRIIVIDDGIDFSEDGMWWFREQRVEFISGKTPFIYARNCNLGINAASSRDDPAYSDVVLLNDDALLETPGGLSAMQDAAAQSPQVGIVSAETNICNNPTQYPRRTRGLRAAQNAPGMSIPAVAFVCVLIPGRTLESVGLLDERYSAYGWEDTDYCHRVVKAGLTVGVFCPCFVDHDKLRSTFRGNPKASGDIGEGRRIYMAKWGKL